MMDRRSWLWRRKSSEKSPGETESSGSISSHSERFSDEQVYTVQNTQSHEVTSKTMMEDVVSDDIKSLKEKLADAVSQIMHKEDTAKQHAKVAEEAIAGWEKAENEVLFVRQQLEAVKQKNLNLEDRMSHLDGALKECVRQLQQAKEMQNQMIDDAIVEKTQEWGILKSELQSQVAYYSNHHTNAVVKMTATMGKDHEFQSKPDALALENSSLKEQLLLLTEQMKVITLERDYSIQAAEIASKLRLESSRKMAKLEADSLKLKSLARKVARFNKNQSVTASSVYMESITDNQSDYGDKVTLLEVDLRKMGILEPKDTEPCSSGSSTTAFVPEVGRFKNEKSRRQNIMYPREENECMNDFLEMERMVAIPNPKSDEYFSSEGTLDGQQNQVEITLRAELECMINRASELEEKLQNTEALNEEVNKALRECQNQLKISQTKLSENEKKLEHAETTNTEMNSTRVVLQKQLQISRTKLKEYAERLGKLKTQLALATESKQAAEKELRITSAKKEGMEARLVNVEVEKGALLETVRFLEGEIEKERSSSAENVARFQTLEDELSQTKIEAENKEEGLLAEMNKNLANCHHLEEELRKTKFEAELNYASSIIARDFEVDQDKQLQIAAQQFAECQKTIVSLGMQLKSLATMEGFILDSENAIINSDEVSPSQDQGMDLSDLRSNKMHMLNNDSEVSTSEARISIALKNSINNVLLSNSTHASERSRSGFGKLSSRGKTRR